MNHGADGLKGRKYHKRKRKNKNVESILVRISPTEKEERLHTQDKYITCKGHEAPRFVTSYILNLMYFHAYNRSVPS